MKLLGNSLLWTLCTELFETTVTIIILFTVHHVGGANLQIPLIIAPTVVLVVVIIVATTIVTSTCVFLAKKHSVDTNTVHSGQSTKDNSCCETNFQDEHVYDCISL